MHALLTRHSLSICVALLPLLHTSCILPSASGILPELGIGNYRATRIRKGELSMQTTVIVKLRDQATPPNEEILHKVYADMPLLPSGEIQSGGDLRRKMIISAHLGESPLNRTFSGRSGIGQ